jgi:hypothetical protein
MKNLWHASLNRLVGGINPPGKKVRTYYAIMEFERNAINNSLPDSTYLALRPIFFVQVPRENEVLAWLYLSDLKILHQN